MNLDWLRKKWVPMTVIGSAVLFVIIIIVAISIPKSINVQKISVEPKFRVDCLPDASVPEESVCLRRGCIWDDNIDQSNINAPDCYYPQSLDYTLVKQLSDGEYELKRVARPGEEEFISQPIETLLLTTEFTDTVAHLKFVDKSKGRYEVPFPLWPDESGDAMKGSSEHFSFTLQNDSYPMLAYKGRSLLNTTIGGLVYNDQFLQIGVYLPGDVLYGFGENSHQTFRHNLSTFKTWPLFARDQQPKATGESLENLYGVHPFCMVLDRDGNAFGILFWNSAAQEYTTGPAPSLVYRTIGGVLDVYIFAGPSPAEVIKQYWSLVGKPVLPAYWSLGFQLCRYGYANTSVVRDVMDRMRQMEIPQDVQYVDIDYMDERADFTIDPHNFHDLPELVQTTKKEHDIRWVFIIDPALDVVRQDYAAFQKAKDDRLLIEWPNAEMVPALNEKYDNTKGTSIMIGTVWPPHNVAFPDFFNPKTAQWWIDQIVNFHQTLNFDGIWIDMNEPANFGTDEAVPWYEIVPELKGIPQLMCPSNALDSPPYPTQAANFWNGTLSSKTLCMLAKQGNYNHYDVHNLYGLSQTEPTLKGVQQATKSRGFLLSRSTFPSSGRYTGHWLGDNSATWDDMRLSIIGMLEFNMFGIPFVGADICGFLLDTNEELCARWHQLGAFYPFSRNHNGKADDRGNYYIEQDPTQWVKVALAAKNSLRLRYHYLPYLYTLFYKANQHSEMVVRPLAFEFPNDTAAVDVDRQFMWGPAMLITPCLEPGVRSVRGYFPEAVWYRVDEPFAEGAKLKSNGYQWLMSYLEVPPPVHVRGGFILPRQKPALNTKQSRQNPLELVVAIEDGKDSAGDLYWDDGSTMDAVFNCSYFIQFHFSTDANEGSLTFSLKTKPTCENVPHLPNLSTLQFYGVRSPFNASTFEYDGKAMELSPSHVNYEVILDKLTIEKENLISLNELQVDKPGVLSWKISKY